MRSGPDVVTMLAAYAEGWFPMDVDGRVGFYEFAPRAVIPLEAFREPTSVRRGLRRAGFEIRIDTAFAEVVAGCAATRRDGGDWLSPGLAEAYVALHAAGHAHSVESWRDGRLAGGLFGIALGGLFTSESMFHRLPDAGNAALVATAHHLRARGYVLWDIQMASEHTARFGAVGLAPDEYRRRLRAALPVSVTFAD